MNEPRSVLCEGSRVLLQFANHLHAGCPGMELAENEGQIWPSISTSTWSFPRATTRQDRFRLTTALADLSNEIVRCAIEYIVVCSWSHTPLPLVTMCVEKGTIQVSASPFGCLVVCWWQGSHSHNAVACCQHRHCCHSCCRVIASCCCCDHCHVVVFVVVVTANKRRQGGWC